MSQCYDFSAMSLSGELIPLQQYQGKVLLIVNTASQCGFTPQYRGLEQLYQTYQSKGFVVLGFPCNQFGAQEPASNNEIGLFCQKNYGVSFPLFGKIDVNGVNAHPLYQYLTTQARGILGSQAIKWNFTKFLIHSDGTVFKRYGSLIAPERIARDIERLLAKPVI